MRGVVRSAKERGNGMGTRKRRCLGRKIAGAIRPGDAVLSYAADGALTPARVARVFVNEAECVLDFHGTGVTPGHAFLCAGGRFAGRHVPLIDILRDDGAIMRQGTTGPSIATATRATSYARRRHSVYDVTRP